MLEELNIHNYALIDRINIKFFKGLNILSGETGAGKSILVGALGLLMGQKGDPSGIRSGAEEALVSGIVNLENNSEALAWLTEHGITPEEGCVILRRLLKRQGRGSIYIGSAPVTRQDLEEFSALVFDMHGQHDNQSLLNVSKHRCLLDRYADIESQVKEFTVKFLELTSVKERFNRLVTSERERLRQIEILKHAATEIRQAALVKGEEDKLDKEHNILANHERLFNLVEGVFKATAESRGGALSLLRQAKDSMDEVVQIDPALSGVCTQLEDSFFELEDFVDSVRRYKSEISYDPDKLREIEERLAIIHALQKKYGDSIEEVLAYGAQCEQELEEIENWENDKQALQAKIALLEKEVVSQAGVLLSRRLQAARKMEQQIEEQLKKLGMPRVRFKVLVEPKKNEQGRTIYSQFGADQIEFMISPNQGEPFKRLKKIASGGEISRIMLSIKSILAIADNINALIFDEIDAGIGGEVAIAVGQTLKQLAEKKQVLCITHLATIAARADTHIKVKKEVKDNRTIALAEILKGTAARQEISRMLSGDHSDQVSLQHAEELLKKYGTK